MTVLPSNCYFLFIHLMVKLNISKCIKSLRKSVNSVLMRDLNLRF